MSIATPALYVMIRTAISMQMEKLKVQPPPIPIPHSHTLHSLFSERLHQDRILSSSGKGPTSCLGHSHTNTSTNQGLQSAQYQIKSHQNTRLAIFFLSRFQEQLGPAVKCFALCTRYMNVNERHGLYFLTKQKRLGQANLECLHIP